ncbi:MAG: phosphoadenosine phosphosulfate reductase family protein, partial [Cyanobacteriota bacterium]|nr:phosphoadenosine phosphosulfate reductase family protein [Cyanobacteriota bacterium]
MTTLNSIDSNSTQDIRSVFGSSDSTRAEISPWQRHHHSRQSPILDLATVNANLSEANAIQIVEWAAETFGSGLVMSSSFGIQSAVMLHLVTRVIPDIPVIWVDTGYLPPQ